MTEDQRSTPGSERPRPQYGEYADDAPQASPHGVASERSRLTDGESTPPAAPSGDAPPAVVPTPTAGALPGVPHNLGVSGAHTPPVPPTAAAPAQPQSSDAQGSPYVAPPPPGARSSSGGPQPSAPPLPAQHSEPQPGQPGREARPRRTVDRVFTILLLGVGALGALNLGFLLLGLGANMHVAANALGVADFQVPAAVSTIGTVGAVITLAVYAVTLIFSIQLMRAGKLAFWVPLAAGAVAFVLYFVITLIAFSQSPELVQAMADPDALNRLLEYSSSLGA